MTDLDDARRAFDEGDYARTRLVADRLAASDASDADKEEARALVRRTEPPTVAKYMFLLVLALLVLMSAFWLGESRGHAPGPAAPKVAAPAGAR